MNYIFLFLSLMLISFLASQEAYCQLDTQDTTKLGIVDESADILTEPLIHPALLLGALTTWLVLCAKKGVLPLSLHQTSLLSNVLGFSRNCRAKI